MQFITGVISIIIGSFYLGLEFGVNLGMGVFLISLAFYGAGE